MRVYTKIVIDIETGKTLEAEWYEHDGEVALVKGGGGGGTTVQQSTQTKANPVVDALSVLGAQFLAPAFGSSFQGFGEGGKPTFSTPTLSVAPITRVREQTWGALEPIIPLLKQQTELAATLPNRLLTAGENPQPLRMGKGGGAPGAGQPGLPAQPGTFGTNLGRVAGAIQPQQRAFAGLTLAPDFEGPLPGPGRRPKPPRPVPGQPIDTLPPFTPQPFPTLPDGTIPSAITARQLAEMEARESFNRGRGGEIFQAGAERLLSQIRPGLAARGIAGSGVAQGIENTALKDLSVDLLAREADQRQAALRGLTGAIGGEEAVRSEQVAREAARSQAIVSSLLGGQSAIARGFQLPLDVLQSAVATEMAPLSALAQLISGASGGTQITSGTTTTNAPKIGGGIFGK